MDKMRSFKSYIEARDWLYSLRNKGSQYGIERMQMFAQSMGHPQNTYSVIHVAGTNGKGSVCAMLESIFRSAGYKTGLFCSPHLLHQGERVKVNNSPMTEYDLLDATNALLPIAEKISENNENNHPTFFEWMTGIAFEHFHKAKVDLAIFETGLGGRLDSTNVVSPIVSVITSIGLDHVEILGDTHEKIAFEKGGIIKPKVPVVIGKVPDEAMEVFQSLAKERNSQLFSVEENFNESNLPKTNLAGKIQQWNAATARLTCQVLQENYPVCNDSISSGLQNTDMPGRWSKMEVNGRTIILDGAHNEDATDALCENLQTLINKTGKRPILVVGFTGSVHRANAFIPKVIPFAEIIIKVEPTHERGLYINSYGEGLAEGKLSNLFPVAQQCEIVPLDRPVVVTGSLYLVAEVMERIQGTSSTGQQKLQD